MFEPFDASGGAVAGVEAGVVVVAGPDPALPVQAPRRRELFIARTGRNGRRKRDRQDKRDNRTAAALAPENARAVSASTAGAPERAVALTPCTALIEL